MPMIHNVRWPELDAEPTERRCAWACLGIVFAAWAGVLAVLMTIWW